MRRAMLRTVLFLIWAAGCSVPRPALTPRESAVTVGKTAPASNARALGAAKSEDGSGCGMLGLTKG